MNLRSVLGSLQLPVAGLGALLVAVAVGGISSLDVPSGSEGFVAGLAVIFLYFLAWIGFVVASLGLAIPPGDGYGITFTRYQRALFLLAGSAAFLSAVGPFALFGLLYSNPSLLVTSLLATMGVAVAALAGGLGWRGVQALQARRERGDPPASNNS